MENNDRTFNIFILIFLIAGLVFGTYMQYAGCDTCKPSESLKSCCGGTHSIVYKTIAVDESGKVVPVIPEYFKSKIEMIE